MLSRVRPLVAVIVLSAGCGGGSGAPPPPSLEAYCQLDAAGVEDRIDAFLRRLTLDEKVRMMAGASAFVQGNVWRVPGNMSLGIPGFRMLDGPRGVSAQSGQAATVFPVGTARGATWDPELERRVGRAIGAEIRAVGVDVLLAPVVNIVRHPRWGRTQESYGEDPHHMGDLAVAFIEGAQEHVLASVKHYAVNSIEDTRFDLDVTVDERTLREIYLPHFRRAVQEAQVASVMTAYNSVNGAYCSQNDHLLREILKGEWEFQGFVESDWVFGTHDTVLAAEAGLDLEMPAAGIYGPMLAAAVRAGTVDEDAVDGAVRRLIRAQLCFALDTDPAVVDPSQLVTAEHVALAREVAQRSIVLLANEGDVLPLDPSALTEIVLVGRLVDVENIGDDGSSEVIPPYVVTALEGITAAAGIGFTVTHIPGETFTVPQEATIAAADAVVVVTGLTSADEGEGFVGAGDRTGLALPTAEASLISAVAALNPAAIVVLEGGGAITMSPWNADVEAVLMAWYPGMEGGNAIADVLFGTVSPSGRLPMSFPAAEVDLPPFDPVSLAVTYGYFHGYRHLQNEGTAPLFPFGHGLSYTTFGYDAVRVSATSVVAGDTLAVEVDLTNTGTVAGIETVQLYVGATSSAVMRAPRDLRAFAQVALSPAQSATVTLAVPVADLAYYDVTAGAWVVEPGDYLVEVGGSSEDLPLQATVTVTAP